MSEKGGHVLVRDHFQISRPDFKMRNRSCLSRPEKGDQSLVEMQDEAGAFRLLQRNSLDDNRKCRVAEHEAARVIKFRQQPILTIADFPRQFWPEEIGPIIALIGRDISDIDDFDQEESVRHGRRLTSRHFDMVFEGAPVGQTGQRIRPRRNLAFFTASRARASLRRSRKRQAIIGRPTVAPTIRRPTLLKNTS